MVGLINFIDILSELTSFVFRVVRFVAELDLMVRIKAINAAQFRADNPARHRL